MQKYPLALFIGRFQPFHNGHLYSLTKACVVGERVIVGIGSSQESGTENNPWDYETRKEMVEAVVRDQGLQGRTLKVVPVPDFPTDPEWVEYIESQIKNYEIRNEKVVIVGNNPWTNDVLREAGFAVFESGLHNRDELEGMKIRELLKKKDDGWKERVPVPVFQRISASAHR